MSFHASLSAQVTPLVFHTQTSPEYTTMSQFIASDRYDFKIPAEPIKDIVSQNSFPEFPCAKFSLYTLCDLPKSTMEEILAEVDKQVNSIFGGPDWDYDEEFDELYRALELPSEWKFPGQDLETLLQHHLARVSAEMATIHPKNRIGELKVYPIGFVLATKADWRDRGLLLVYLDREEDVSEHKNLLVKTSVPCMDRNDGLGGDLTTLRLGDDYFDHIRAWHDRAAQEGTKT